MVDRLVSGVDLMADFALPMQGPAKTDCPCGCGLFGMPKGKRGHIRGCPCRPCLNGRNSKGGKSRQRSFANEAGVRKSKHRSQMGHEENWLDHFRWEVKSGKQVDPVVTRYEAAKAQSEVSRAVGDARPFAMGVVPTEGKRPRLVLVEAEVWREVIVPLMDEVWGTDR